MMNKTNQQSNDLQGKSKELYDSNKRRFPTHVEDPWVPGLVEVEFRSAEESGLAHYDFSGPLDRADRSSYWSQSLSGFLDENRMVVWRPSFPLKYSWSRETEAEARAFYKDSGRDRLVTFRFPNDADVLKIAKRLEMLPEVTNANPVPRLAPPAIEEELLGTSDQVELIRGFESQWYAYRCKLPAALEMVTGRDVVIADIDWGFDVGHPEYATAIELKWNIFNKNDGVSEGATEHGTAVLGLAAARLNNEGIVGFAPDSVLWAIQAGKDDPFVIDPVQHLDWAEAIDFVRSQPSTKCKVIILELQTASGGNVEAIDAIRNAILAAIAANIVVCVPAGNSPGDAGLSDNNREIPVTGSVLVSATSYHPQGNNVNGCKEGPRIVVYAPGDMEHDVTCDPGTYTNIFGGTSGAVAKVAGAVALMLEADNSLTPAQVREILGKSTIPVRNDKNEEVGVLLDCQNAVTEVLRRMEDVEHAYVP